MLAAAAVSQNPDDPLEGLELREVPTPQPGPGWALVRVASSALSMHDLWTLRGVGHPAERLPMVLGCDVSGYDEDGNPVIVHAVIADPDAGRGDETLDPNRALLTERQHGGFAEYISVPQRNLVAMPPWLTFDEAACLPVAWTTAYRIPVVPIFINGVATPLCPVARIRALGNAVGEAAADLDRRVLLRASGGLSHDPPVPVPDGAPPKVADALIEGHPPTPEQRARGEGRVVEAGRQYAAGATTMIPINPGWDNRFLDLLGHGPLGEFDTWTTEAMAAEGGGSAHEVRTWIAAFASLAAVGSYTMDLRFYEPIPAWTAGFGVVTGRLTEAARWA